MFINTLGGGAGLNGGGGKVLSRWKGDQRVFRSKGGVKKFVTLKV